MERLTEKRDGQNVIPLRQDGKVKWALCNAGKGDEPTQYLYGEFADKLAEYENIGYTSEQVIEMAKELEELKKQLPSCKVGDTVYTNTSMQGWYLKKKDRPYKAKIVFIGINGVDNYINVDLGNGHMLQFLFSQIGKTVFLTKEAAEAKLKEGGVK